MSRHEHLGPTAAAGAVTRSRVTSPVLVGRARELGLLAGAISSPPAVAIIEGEAGIGKTRVVAELLARPETEGKRVLVGRCHQIREPFPLGPVLEALRALGADLARLELTPLAGVLRPLLPELADVLPSAPEPLGDPVAERHRVFRAVREVLAAVGPAVLVLEDLHWVDEHTLELLGFLMSDQPQELVIAFTYRGQEAPPGVRTLASRLPSSTVRASLELEALDEPDTGALAAAILEVEHVSDEFAAHLHARASGVPLAIEELLALLRERGELVRRGSGWTRRALDELGVPGALRDAVLERAGHLSADARAVTEAAAALHMSAPAHVVIEVSGLPAPRFETGLSEALASGLLEERAGGVGFRHVLAAEAVYEGLPGMHRRELHERAADVFEASEPPALGQLAHHLKRAGRLEEWARCAEEAANQAAGLGDDEGAAVLLEDVLTHAPPEVPGRGRVALKLARAAVHGLVPGEHLGVLLKVLDGDDLPKIERGELRLAVALLLDLAGDQVACYEQLEKAVPELEDRPPSQVRAMAALSGLNVPAVTVEEHLGWMQRSLESLAKVRDPVVETAVLGNRAVVLTTVGAKTWRDSVEAIPTEATSREHQKELGRAAHGIATVACSTGHYAAADVFLARGRVVAKKGRDKQRELALDAVSAALDYGRGRWDGLDDAVGALCGELAEVPLFRVDVEWVAGCLALARGHPDTAQVRLEEALDIAERAAAVDALAPPAGTLARIQLAHGDAVAAVSSAMRCISFLEPKGLWAPAGPAVRWAVEALFAGGQQDEAAALVQRFAAGLQEKDAPIATAALKMCRGIVAEAEGRPQVAAGEFLQAADAYAHLPCPYEAAQARERAALCFSATDAARAEETLRAALATYERLGASWDAARCARAARTHGLSVPAPYRGGRKGYGDVLSPREEEVARLAAAGYSNKEIAAELFLAGSTVKKHLSGAMRKLGVRSRAALAHRLQEDDLKA